MSLVHTKMHIDAMNSESYKKKETCILFHVIYCTCSIQGGRTLTSRIRPNNLDNNNNNNNSNINNNNNYGEKEKTEEEVSEISHYFLQSGVYGNDIMSILPGYLECYFPIHSHSGKKNGNTLPRVGMNWKIHPLGRFAPLGPRDCLRGRILQ